MKTIDEVVELVNFLVKKIVNDADAVSISTRDEAGVIVFEVHVAENDIGRVVGRHGKIAQSIRTIVNGSNKTGNRIIVKFM